MDIIPTLSVTTDSSVGSILSRAGEVMTWIFGQIATVAGVIIDNPILFIGFGLFITGAVIAFFVRFLRST
jgi:hypothetical protein